MSTTSEPEEGYRGTPPPPPSDVNSIVPGSIFQDEIPPPTLAEASGYEPQQIGPSSSTSTGSSSRSGGGSGIGSGHIQIEVNPTIQTVLVSLGICVGALFLLGVIATHYISHKNKRAEEKKKKALGEKGGMFDDGDEGGLGVGEKGKNTGRTDLEIVLIDEKDGGGVGHYLLGPTQPPKSKIKGFINNTPNSSPPGSTQSPKSSIIGGVGRAVGGGGHAGTGSFQMGASGPRGPGSANPRNSFMEVAQVYARRQSITPTPIPPTAMPMPAHMSLRAATPGYSQVDHPRQAGIPPELHLGSGLYQDDTSAYHCAQDLSSPMFSISPSSIGTNDNLEKNPFASPPLSAGSKSSLLLDPFRTQNNSQFSLNLVMTNEDNTNGGRDADDDDTYPFPPAGGASTDFNSVSSTSNSGDRLGFRERMMKGMPTSNSSPSISSSSATHPFSPQAPLRSLDDLTEPKLVLRQIQSAIPSYHRHTLMHTSNTPPPTTSVTNIFESSGYGSGPPATRSTVERQVGFSPGVVHDRRSIAGSVVTPGNGGGCHSANGSINEGNAWYRKRASVIIPEGGTAHVKLWKDGESYSSSSPSGIMNRSSRSSSQSSSQSQNSNYQATTAPSPLGMNQQRKDSQEAAEQLQQQAIQRAQKRLDDAKEDDQKMGLSPVPVARDGAAVFEGKLRATSRSPSPSRGALVPVIITDNQLVMEPGQDAEPNCRSKEDQEMDQVVVRLRTPRRGSHSGSTHSNRQSYLDDYREQQQRQLQQ
ncbi:hypothetical protein BGX26_001567 [Mortierella sp. AD094]|nr:hypothetical protein BGX26_001567 [Mortierella sp. AD094]